LLLLLEEPVLVGYVSGPDRQSLFVSSYDLNV
jgi:hypothetical protein